MTVVGRDKMLVRVPLSWLDDYHAALTIRRWSREVASANGTEAQRQWVEQRRADVGDAISRGERSAHGLGLLEEMRVRIGDLQDHLDADEMPVVVEGMTMDAIRTLRELAARIEEVLPEP